MSDLYLLLRRRLEDVADWTTLGTETMLTARNAKGLSHEAMGRLLHVAGKTYDRWEKRGQVPRHYVMQVADVLDLEIEEPARLRVVAEQQHADDEDIAGQLADLVAQVRANGVLLTELLRLVQERLEPPQSAGRA